MSSRDSALKEGADWFSGLARSSVERLPNEHPLLLSPDDIGWKVQTNFGDVVVVLDADFPFSRASFYWLDFDPSNPRPHVEREGKLCLRSPVLPSEPLRSVQEAVREGIELLRKNAKGELDADFDEDFLAYWNYYAAPSLAASMLPKLSASRVGAAAVTGRRRYIFQSKEDARRWWENRSAQFFRNLPRVAVIKLKALPHPKQFPNTAKELRWLIENHSADGKDVLNDVIKPIPKSAIVALVADDLAGNQHVFSCLLSRPIEKNSAYVHWKQMSRGYRRNNVPPEVLCDRYELKRLRMEVLDGALSRVPYDVKNTLEKKKVAVIGCGALGSGVARLLAQSGVGSLLLVDPENLDWENLRRHELGSNDVGSSKSEMLGVRIRNQVPDIQSVEHITSTVQNLIRSNPKVFDLVDLIVSATGDFIADSSVAYLQATKAFNKPVVFAWLEPYAVAAHAVVTETKIAAFELGFDENGLFKEHASENTNPPPRQCGGSTTPFGAVETTQAQAMTSQLVLEVLQNKVAAGVWRTWTSNSVTLADSGGNWTKSWIAKRGLPPLLGGMSESVWKF